MLMAVRHDATPQALAHNSTTWHQAALACAQAAASAALAATLQSQADRRGVQLLPGRRKPSGGSVCP